MWLLLTEKCLDHCKNVLPGTDVSLPIYLIGLNLEEAVEKKNISLANNDPNKRTNQQSQSLFAACNQLETLSPSLEHTQKEKGANCLPISTFGSPL